MRTDIISRDASGTIVIPREYSYIMTQPYIHSAAPTVDPGFYHRYQARGERYWDASVAIDQFATAMKDVPGFVILDTVKHNMEGVGALNHTLDIFYAVDGPVPPGTKGNRMQAAMLYPYR